MHRTMTGLMMALSLVVVTAAANPAHAQDYQIKITNLTNAQAFTPILAAIHSPGVAMFVAGTAASAELQTLAESGDTVPLARVLSGLTGVADMTTSAGLTTRGVTTELMLTASGSATRLSLAAMLIPTNDAFMGLNVLLPTGFETMEVYAYAYDAGTEINDELCASIPGPPYAECGGPGGGATRGGP